MGKDNMSKNNIGLLYRQSVASAYSISRKRHVDTFVLDTRNNIDLGVVGTHKLYKNEPNATRTKKDTHGTVQIVLKPNATMDHTFPNRAISLKERDPEYIANIGLENSSGSLFRLPYQRRPYNTYTIGKRAVRHYYPKRQQKSFKEICQQAYGNLPKGRKRIYKVQRDDGGLTYLLSGCSLISGHKILSNVKNNIKSTT